MPGAGMTDAEQRLSEVGGTPTCKQTNTFFKKNTGLLNFHLNTKKKKRLSANQILCGKTRTQWFCSASKEEEKGQKPSRSSLTKVKKRCWQTPVLQHQSH